jgi:hypothetical protein
MMKNAILLKRNEYSENNYIRKAKPEDNYWFDFSYEKLSDYKKKFGANFNLILFGDENAEGDFYIIPFSEVKHIFTEEHFSHDLKKDSKRWVGTIKNNILKVSNCKATLDCTQYYGNQNLINAKTLDPDEENDYAINNKLMEIKARQKQSKFRKSVLNNFENRCCITGISEKDLLIASHIIPWAAKVETRLDPANGLCLFVLYDALFDQGYFSLDNNYKIIIPNNIEQFSSNLKIILEEIKGKKIFEPKNKKINLDYIKYHRENIFKQKNGA